MTNSKIFGIDLTGLYAHWAVHRYSLNDPIFLSCKILEFFKNSPLSGAGEHHNFQVTSCHHFVTTDVKFDE